MALQSTSKSDVRRRAIERAKAAFLAARTSFQRRKAMRELEELGAGPKKGRE